MVAASGRMHRALTVGTFAMPEFKVTLPNSNDNYIKKVSGSLKSREMGISVMNSLQFKE